MFNELRMVLLKYLKFSPFLLNDTICFIGKPATCTQPITIIDNILGKTDRSILHLMELR